MSIKVNISPDVSSFKEKIFLNLTLRQIISIGVTFILTIFFNSVLHLPPFIRRVSIVAIVTPVLLIGFVKYQGLYFEKYLYYMFLKYWNPQKRLFKQEINVINEIRHTKGGQNIEHNSRKKDIKRNKKDKNRKSI